MAALLQQHKVSMRYVDYQQAERDCELLAVRILQDFSPTELARFSFAAIPRGGLIVLGMLSYMLELRPDQLLAEPASRRPLFIVDDCALSGARFAEMLARARSTEVVFAHLYSPPGLRRVVLERESRVVGCLAAHDLADRARHSVDRPEEELSWQRKWRRLLGPDRYWYGQPEMVCFAWNEPPGLFWNPLTERVENGWRFLPPHRCLRNRTRLVGPLRRLPAGGWRVPETVVNGDFDGVLWLCQTETDQVFSLNGVAADMWRGLVGWGSEDPTVEELISAYSVDEKTARRDLAEFARRMVAKRLLEKSR